MKTYRMWDRGQINLLAESECVKEGIWTEGCFILPDVAVHWTERLNTLYKYSKLSIEDFLKNRQIDFEEAPQFMENEEHIFFCRCEDRFYASFQMGSVELIQVNQRIVSIQHDEPSVPVEIQDYELLRWEEISVYPVARLDGTKVVDRYLALKEPARWPGVSNGIILDQAKFELIRQIL